jgi:hypothetical protein
MTKLPTGKPILPFTPTVDAIGEQEVATATVLDLFYTYIWRDPAGVPFYVGKGKRKRAWVTKNRSPAFNEIHSMGGCSVEIADLFMHESQAHAHEMELIELYGRRDNGTGTLVNLTDGGEGSIGWVPSDETRAKIAKAAIGRMPSKEHRAKISEANRGRKLSPEHIAKVAEANRGKTLSDAAKAKIGAANRGNKYALAAVRSLETRAKLSEAKRGKATRLGAVLSEETRNKIAEALRGKTLSVEHRMKMSKASRGKPKTPEHIAAVADALHALPPRADSSSGFKGVSKSRDRWVARISIGGKRQTIGYFPSAEEAANAYNAAAVEAWGDGNCYLNFIDRQEVA